MSATLVGQRFGALDIFDGPHWRGESSYWFARCDCGEMDFVRDAGLIAGNGAAAVRACGPCRSRKAREHLPLAFVHHRIRISANVAVQEAIKRGVMERRTACERPGCKSSFCVGAHHPDYSKPLLVEWLCASCHGETHSAYRRDGHDTLAAYRHIIGPDVVRPRQPPRGKDRVDALRAALRKEEAA